MIRKARPKRSSRGKKPEVVVFFTTFANIEAAKNFAHTAVREGHAACVNVCEGITSVYRWNNQINEDQEVLIMGKTTVAQFKSLKNKFKTIHSYVAPELICIRVSDGLPEYLQWIANSLK